MSKEDNFECREQELKRREQELRMRELEAEVEQRYKTEFYQTQKYQSSDRQSVNLGQKNSKFIKYIAFVSFGFFVMTGGLFLVSIWLSYGIMFALLSFVGYKIFLENNSHK